MIRAFFKGTKLVITFIFLCGLALSILPFFNWDILAFLSWAVDKIWKLTVNFADKLSSSEVFKSLFR